MWHAVKGALLGEVETHRQHWGLIISNNPSNATSALNGHRAECQLNHYVEKRGHRPASFTL